MKIYSLAAALLLAIAGALPARAVSTTGGAPFYLQIPNFGDAGNVWAASLQYDFNKLSTGTIISSTTSWPIFGRITVTTITAVNSTGIYFSSSPVVAAGSITASGFFGNGSALTGVASTATVIRDGNGNATVPYGIGAATGSFSANLGIGGSVLGTRKVQINGTANNASPSYGDGLIRIGDSGNGVGVEIGALYGGSQASWLQSGNEYSGTTKPLAFNPSGGNVGIGETNPSATLDVGSNVSPTGYVVAVSSQDDTHAMFNIQGNGNVGIGVTSPSALFQVAVSSFVVQRSGHTDFGGGVPTLSACGTSPTFFQAYDDSKGCFQSGSGAGGTTCTLNFGLAYETTIPICVVSPMRASASTTKAPTAWGVTASVGFANLIASEYYCYICLGH